MSNIATCLRHSAGLAPASLAVYKSVTRQQISKMNLSEVKLKYPDCTTFTFGDNRELCDELISLVRNGRKTATCEALRVFEAGSEMMPSVGQIEIVLNWDGTPAIAIRVLSIAIRKLNEIDELFALAEGENNSLEEWKLDHQGYFKRNGGFDSEMKLVCERFELAEDFEKKHS